MIEETWTLAPAARAAGVPLPFAKRALDRALLHPDVEGRGAGCYRELVRSTIYKIALIWTLNQLSVPPGSASEHAAAFTDRGQPDRHSGRLFETGHTLLIIAPGGDTAVVNTAPGSLLADVFFGEAAVVVDVGQIVEAVDRRLGTFSTLNSRRCGAPSLEFT